MRHNPLLAALRAAFPSSPIAASGAFEQRGITYPGASAYVEAMDGKSWDTLDADFFARRADALYFLGDLHLALMLPLYLNLLAVVVPTWSPVPEALVSLLTRPEPSDPPAKLFGWQKRRFDGLTHHLNDEQKRLVARSLEKFIADTPHGDADAELALDRYWRAFA